MFSFPLSSPDSSCLKSILPLPSPHYHFSALSLFCLQLPLQSLCHSWCWSAPCVPLCPPDSSFHFLASDFPPASLKSCLLIFPLLSSFPRFPTSLTFPLSSPHPYPVPQLSVLLLNCLPASLSNPHLSSQELSSQCSLSCSPLPPYTTPSPLSCLLRLPPEPPTQQCSMTLPPH